VKQNNDGKKHMKMYMPKELSTLLEQLTAFRSMQEESQKCKKHIIDYKVDKSNEPRA
jgi:hypothetical protein